MKTDAKTHFMPGASAKVAGFCGALALLLGTALPAGDAFANNRSYSAIAQTIDASHDAGAIRIQSPGEGINRSIVLPFSKSTVVELPVPAMDVFVSNPDVVEAVIHTGQRTVLIGKSSGQTNVYFYGHDGQELLNIDIRVERDINGLNALMRKHAPGAEVDAQAINGNIMLTGSVPNAQTALKVERIAKMWQGAAQPGQVQGEIVNLLSVAGRDQVMLKVRIVEMQRSVVKQMGLNLNAVGQIGNGTVSLFNDLAVESQAGFVGSFDVTPSAGDLTSLGGALTALERVGIVRTLAEPTLTAISGETANFLSGGEFPLFGGSTVDPTTGRLTRNFEFKSFGVALGFTPVVLSEGLISLNISTEVSEPTNENSFQAGEDGLNVPGIRVRRANTVVEVPAGGSVVIAGLIREEARSEVEGTPGAKDIPGLGALFRNRDSQTVQTEVVIIATAYLVDPTHPDKLQTPLDGFSPASDREQLLMGRLNKVYGEGAASETLAGPFGHVVD